MSRGTANEAIQRLSYLTMHFSTERVVARTRSQPHRCRGLLNVAQSRRVLPSLVDPSPPTDPHSWTSEDVCQWVREVKSAHKKQHYFSKVKESRYKNFRGEMLCSLRKDIFLAFESGFAGEHLFEDLQRRIRSECVAFAICHCVCMWLFQQQLGDRTC